MEILSVCVGSSCVLSGILGREWKDVQCRVRVKVLLSREYINNVPPSINFRGYTLDRDDNEQSLSLLGGFPERGRLFTRVVIC